MRKIIIPIYDGAISKNILRTDIFKELARRYEIVLVVIPEKVEFYKREFGSENIFIEPLVRLGKKDLKLELIFNFLFFNSIYSNGTKIRARHQYVQDGKAVFYATKLALRFLGKFKLWKWVLRRLYRITPARPYKNLFDRLDPDAVFAPNVTATHENLLLKEAMMRGLPTIGMTKSWDNLISKAFIPVIPGRLIVQNEILRDEAEFLSFVPKERIVVSGFPQFDIYTKQEAFISKEEFLKKIGITDFQPRKIILYCAAGFLFTRHDREILAELDNKIHAGDLPQDALILVRLHPKYEHAEGNLPVSKYIRIYRPGTNVDPAKASSWEFNDEDIMILANSLYHADVVVNTGSTMTVEACLFDKPVICIGYDGHEDYYKSMRRFYDFEHFQHIFKKKAVPIAYSHSELLGHINRYLENPILDSEARCMVAAEQAPYRGEAGRRAAQFISEYVG